MATPVSKLSTNFFDVIDEKITKLKAEGADVIRLDIGSPDLPPAPHIIHALTQSAMQSNNHGYQSHRGIPTLREAWASMYKRVHNVDLTPEYVLPLLGSKEGIFHLSLAVLNPGDIVLVPDPAYQTYSQAARFAGAEPYPLPLLPENDYLPDFSALPPEITKRARLLWLNYPHNPTAAVVTLDTFAEAISFCKDHGILLCHDAAYTQVTFEDYHAPSVLEVPGAMDVSVEFNTLSKSHNMAGWRVGVAVGHPESVLALLKLKTHADSGHFLPVMEASVAALTGDQSWLQERNAIYQERRDMVVAALGGAGFMVSTPQASIYVWLKLPEPLDSNKFVLNLLDEAHLSLAPGSMFGSQGNGYVRVSLTQPFERMVEAMDRFCNWLSDRLS